MRSWWRHGGGWPRLRLRTRRCTSKRSRADLHSNLHGGGCSAAGAGGEAPRRDGARKPQVPAKRCADAAAGPRRDRPPITANPAAAGTANPPHQRLRPERAAALPSPCGAREPGNSDERCSDGDDCKSEESGGSGRNDDCCHRSHKGGKVLCCSGVVCYRAWHALCLPAVAMDTTGTGDDWEMPGLQGEFRAAQEAWPRPPKAGAIGACPAYRLKSQWAALRAPATGLVGGDQMLLLECLERPSYSVSVRLP